MLIVYLSIGLTVFTTIVSCVIWGIKLYLAKRVIDNNAQQNNPNINPTNSPINNPTDQPANNPTNNENNNPYVNPNINQNSPNKFNIQISIEDNVPDSNSKKLNNQAETANDNLENEEQKKYKTIEMKNII